MKWKPISSAPKDGTYILTRIVGTYKGRNVFFIPCVVAYSHGKWLEDDELKDGFYEDCTEYNPDEWCELPPLENGGRYVTAND